MDRKRKKGFGKENNFTDRLGMEYKRICREMEEMEWS